MGCKQVGKLGFAIGLLSLLVLAQACEQSEGCLDYNALRLDIQADQPCDDCCQYPQLTLQLLPVILQPDTFQVVGRNALFVDQDGDSLRLQSLVFFLSDIVLETANGDSIRLSDVQQIRADSTLPFEEQPLSVYKVAPLRQAAVNTGTLLGNQDIVALHFRLGLPSAFYGYVPAAQGTGAPLLLGQDTFLYDSAEQRYNNGFVLLSSMQDSVRLVQLDQDNSQRISVRFTEAISYERSFNLRITLAVPLNALAEWPSGILSSERFADELLRQAQPLRVELFR